MFTSTNGNALVRVETRIVSRYVVAIRVGPLPVVEYMNSIAGIQDDRIIDYLIVIGAIYQVYTILLILFYIVTFYDITR